MTPPETKGKIQFTDDLKPAVLIGDYVRVTGDTSPVFNFPYGYGFVK